MAIGPLFPTANTFSWVGTDFIWETDCKEPNPTKIVREHPIVSPLVGWLGEGWVNGWMNGWAKVG